MHLLSFLFFISACSAGLFVLLLLLIYVKWDVCKRNLLYFHFMRWPLFLKPLHVESEHHVPIIIETEDKERLGAWIYHHRGHKEIRKQSTKELSTFYTVVLLFHGRGVTRGREKLQRQMNIISRTLDCAILIFDYRGFGDSTGYPSEHGLQKDAEAVWKFAVEILKAKEVIIWGQSIGSGPATYLAQLKSQQYDSISTDVKIVLEAPYTSIKDALITHWMFPFMKWFSHKRQKAIADAVVDDNWHNHQRIRDICYPIVIMHAKDDLVIPQSHGIELHSNCPMAQSFFPEKGGHGGMVFLPEFTKMLYEFVMND